MNVLVYIETRSGKVRPAGFEALTAGKSLAGVLGGKMSAVMIGTGLDALKSQVAGYGIERLYLADAPELQNYSPEGFREALLIALNTSGASILVMTATSLGRDLGPVMAARLDAAFLPDCTELSFSDGKLVIKRPVYAGRLHVSLTTGSFPAVVTLRPKAFLPVKSGGDEPATEQLTVNLSGVTLSRCIESREEAGGKMDVTEADVIVAGGRGLKGPENFHLVEDLAGALGGAIGVSRPVVDSGWRPHSEQVGQTGKVVNPTLYIAAGISGAIQHLAGMRSSKVIVAINKDPEAPIFKAADYGIVGDVFEVLPALTQAVKALGK